jgi:glycerol-3-phosphate dehydrogenase
VAEADRIIDDARAMLPILERTRYIRAYAGVRPLVSLGPAGDDRAVSRGFALIDHAEEGIDNFITITGGKLTTYRLMAEKAADLACAKLGVSSALPDPDGSPARLDPGQMDRAGARPQELGGQPDRG